MTIAALEPRTEAAEKTLDELAEIANSEYAAACQSIHDSLVHVIRCGEALNQARQQFGATGWPDWVTTNVHMSRAQASRLMRLAHYQEVIPEEARTHYLDSMGRRHEPSWSRAETFIRGLPHVFDANENRRYSPNLIEEITRLHQLGLNTGEIGRMVGLSSDAVWKVVHKDRHNAAQRASQRRKRLERQALDGKQRERDRYAAAKQAGGSLAESYSLLRRLAQRLDQARAETTDNTVRVSLSEALANIYAGEDAIARALKVP